MTAKFCIQNIYKSLSKCGIHFACKHFVYILYTLILVLEKVYITKTVYTICIQNSYRMYIQIIVCRMVLLFQHIVRLICCALPSYSLQTIRPKTYNLLANHGRYLSNQWINGLYIALNCQ